MLHGGGPRAAWGRPSCCMGEALVLHGGGPRAAWGRPLYMSRYS